MPYNAANTGEQRVASPARGACMSAWPCYALFPCLALGRNDDITKNENVVKGVSEHKEHKSRDKPSSGIF